MLGRQLDGGDVLLACEEVDLLGGGDVQDVDALAGFARQPYQAVGGADGGLRVAHFGVARPVALAR